MINQSFVIVDQSGTLCFIRKEIIIPEGKRQQRRVSDYILTKDGRVVKNRWNGNTYIQRYSWRDRLHIFFHGTRY